MFVLLCFLTFNGYVASDDALLWYFLLLLFLIFFFSNFGAMLETFWEFMLGHTVYGTQSLFIF